MNLEEVATFLDGLPAVTIGTWWTNRTWSVNGHGFAWQRPFSKADLARYGDATPPSGDIVAVIVENLDAKDAVLAMELPGFFTIQHFNGYAAVLIELRRARKRDVRAAITSAYHVAAARPRKKPKPKPKPTKRR